MKRKQFRKGLFSIILAAVFFSLCGCAPDTAPTLPERLKRQPQTAAVESSTEYLPETEAYSEEAVSDFTDETETVFPEPFYGIRNTWLGDSKTFRYVDRTHIAFFIPEHEHHLQIVF